MKKIAYTKCNLLKDTGFDACIIKGIIGYALLLLFVFGSVYLLNRYVSNADIILIILNIFLFLILFICCLFGTLQFWKARCIYKQIKENDFEIVKGICSNKREGQFEDQNCIWLRIGDREIPCASPAVEQAEIGQEYYCIICDFKIFDSFLHFSTQNGVLLNCKKYEMDEELSVLIETQEGHNKNG